MDWKAFGLFYLGGIGVVMSLCIGMGIYSMMEGTLLAWGLSLSLAFTGILLSAVPICSAMERWDL